MTDHDPADPRPEMVDRLLAHFYGDGPQLTGEELVDVGVTPADMAAVVALAKADAEMTREHSAAEREAAFASLCATFATFVEVAATWGPERRYDITAGVRAFADGAEACLRP